MNKSKGQLQRYVVLDIENPNARANSICSIGIIIKDGDRLGEVSTLIDPEDRFDPRNVEINGINGSQVVGKPTFKEIWGKIKNILTNNIIIGHNIVYDLSVIAKSLDRYGIAPPTFRYIDTLNLAQRFMSLDSYKLEYISDYLNFSYKAHDAMEDTRAAHYLFEYIANNFGIDESMVEVFDYTPDLKENLDERLATNINELYGLIKGINYDGVIDDFEISQLRKWSDDNAQYKQYALFYAILNTIDRILADNKIDEYERIELLNLVSSINNSRIYTEATLSLQTLQGILNGISCNNKIVAKEIINLKKWLDINDYLSGVYPYDKVLLTVNKVIEDGILTKAEEEELAETFKEIINPHSSHVDKNSISGKTFCLSGEFKMGDKSFVKSKLEGLGGIPKEKVIKKLDYLFIGGLGSDAWKFGKFGGKVAKAQEYNEKGSNIIIADEGELESILSSKH